MTFTSRPAVQVRQLLAVLAAAALAFALLPLSGAHAQEAPPQRSIDLACPEGQVDDAGFPDRSPTFQRYIDCIIAYEIAVGRADGTYGPTAPITRGQMATFVANLLVEAGEELDPAPADTYTDTQGTTHEANILAISNTDPAIAEGFGDGTFRPSSFVRRDQMASFIATAHEVITGDAWDVSETPFTDIDGSVHEDNIGRLYGSGITVGTTATTYSPRLPITRGQMAAFFARHIDILIELGHIEPRFEPAPPPTNQTFAVTPTDATALPQNDEREYTVAVGQGTEVEIALVECDDVTVTEGIVTFADTDGEADLYTDADASITDVNGVVQVAGTSQATATGDAEGDVTFTVTGNNSVCVVPVVWVDEDEDGELNIDGDGEPTEDFGIGGATTFSDVAALTLTQDEDANRFATSHSVTATLEDAAVDGDVVPADGQTVSFRVIDSSDAPGEICEDAVFANITVGQLLESGSVTTVDGMATFTYTGPDETEAGVDETVDHCIVAEWDGSGDFDGQGPFEDSIEKTWTNVETVSITAAPAQSSNLVSTNHTVTGTLENQFGEPVAGESVRFEVVRTVGSDFVATRTTNAEGVATLTYTGPAAADEDNITVCADEGIIGGVCDDAVNVDHVDEAVKFWVETAESTVSTTAGDTVVGFDTDGDTVDAADERFTYQVGDQYTVECGADAGATSFAVTITGFETALSLDDLITIDPYDTDGVSVIVLRDEDNTHPTCAAI